jgi:hypothetical protein
LVHDVDCVLFRYEAARALMNISNTRNPPTKVGAQLKPLQLAWITRVDSPIK